MKKKSNPRNAGRKPEPDPKKVVRCYPRQSAIDACGGLESAQNIALRAIETEAAKRLMNITVLNQQP